MCKSVKRGSLPEVLAGLDEKPKGEYTIVIRARDKDCGPKKTRRC